MIARTLLVSALLSSASVQGQPQSGPLKIVGPARLTLDPVCNARSGRDFVTQLRNDGSMPVSIALSALEPMSKPAGKVAVAQAIVEPLNSLGRAGSKNTSIAPGEVLEVRVHLIGTLESGEWEVEIRNAGAPAGAIAVTSPQVPFGVKLDVPTSAPQLVFERGRPATIPLKNEDAFGYNVAAQYSVRGIVQKVPAISLSPNGGGGELALTPPDAWFETVDKQSSGQVEAIWNWVRRRFAGARGLLKDEVADGMLTLQYLSPKCADDANTTTRSFRVRTTLLEWSPTDKEHLSNLLLLWTLVFGGLVSLALNFFLPAYSRRQKAREQLSLAARQIDDLRSGTDSQVRASLTAERLQVDERVSRLSLFSANFSPEVTEIEQSLSRLRLRLDLLAQMDLVLAQYWRMRDNLPWMLTEEIDKLRQNLIERLRRSNPSDEDNQLAKSLIRQLEERLKNATVADPDLARRLASKIEDLKRDFGEKGAIATSPLWKEIRSELDERFDDLIAYDAPKDIAPADYVRLGRLVFMLEQVRTFIRQCNRAPTQEELEAERKWRKDLVSNLKAGGWEHFKRAERLIREMRDNISATDLAAEISERRVRIATTRSVVRQFEPTELRVEFLAKRFQNSAIRDTYTCNWDFGYGNMKGTGWWISHVFPFATHPDPSAPASEDKSENEHNMKFKPNPVIQLWRSFVASLPKRSTLPRKPYPVKAHLLAENGKEVAVISYQLEVQPQVAPSARASVVVEGLRLSLALGIAAAALFLGAREQILKLDPFPALIAVFMLGFGSDRIKNFFVQKAEAAETKASETKSATGS